MLALDDWPVLMESLMPARSQAGRLSTALLALLIPIVTSDLALAQEAPPKVITLDAAEDVYWGYNS